MARKRISGGDLSWLISEELFDSGSRAARMSLAVVPDDKHGWRVIVAHRGRRFLTSSDERRLADVQQRLCRFAWTTQTRCPHIHSRRKTSSKKLLDSEGQEQARLHLNSGDPWSRVWGPLQSAVTPLRCIPRSAG